VRPSPTDDGACVGHRNNYRLDDLRRFGTALASGVGVAPARASAFVSGLLWYDAADAPSLGIASLPDWIRSIEAAEIDPRAEGTLTREFPATAVMDGGRGLGPLILRRAAEVAQEKAREVGVGMVQVVNLSGTGLAGWVASEIAVGPTVGSVEGPGVWALALPVAESVPVVIDTRLGEAGPDPSWPRLAAMPSASGDRDEPTWVVTARAVNVFESLASFHARVARAFEEHPAPAGWEVRPDAWQARRLAQIEHGLPLGKSARAGLQAWGRRLDVPWPSPTGRA
jgi:hypothetical protein